MPTLQADQPDIRPEAHDLPVKSAAGMRFAQPDAVTQAHIPRGDRCPDCFIINPIRANIGTSQILFITHNPIIPPCYNFLRQRKAKIMMNLSPATLIARVITLIIAFTIHEFSHAWVATRFGDNTPEQAGRLSLNPLRHLDPMGSLMLLLAGFGWAKPVPINPYTIRRNNSAGVMLVSVAGPLSNLLLAILAAIPLRLGLFPTTLQATSFLPTPGYFLVEFIYTNVALFLFNMIPLAPLDGEKVLEYLLPRSWQGTFQTIRQYGPYILLALVIVGPRVGFDLIGIVVRKPLMAIVRFLIGA